MPKKKSSRPNSSLGSSQKPEPKSASQIRRERTVRTAAIVIVLALLLSLIAGAFSVTPSQAAGFGGLTVQSAGPGKSVQVLAADDATLDTDRDGIVNNLDPDIDGDGVVNGVDPDIDGDGKPNFGDGDPAETNGIDSKTPDHPEGVTIENLVKDNPGWTWLVAGAVAVTAALVIVFFRRKKLKK